MANTAMTTTTTEKITKKEYLNALLKHVSKMNADLFPADTVSFLQNEINLLDKRAEVSEATAKANDTLSMTVIEVMTDLGKPVTISEMLVDSRLKTYTVVESGASVEKPLSNQKMTALMKKMQEAGKVVRTEVRKKAYFSLA